MRQTKKRDPFENLMLDEEEQTLEDALFENTVIEDKQLDETKKMLEEAALRYKELHTSKPVTIRVNQLDLVRLKAKARKKNIPYQTLLGALIHQYALGEENLCF